MPPFCMTHQKYHGVPHECRAMTRAANRLAAEKARTAKAEQIAAEHMEAFTIRDGDVDECSEGYIRDLLTAAALAGMDAA